MTEEEKRAIEKFRKLGIKKFREEKLTNEDLLSYFEFVIILNLIEKLQKENEELKKENEYNKILLDTNNNFMIDKKTGNYKWNVIEIQKIKDKIISNENIIDISNDGDLIHEKYQENKVYEELLKEFE